MKPAPPETAEIITRVRQQLILAQVRIMELEDTRDALLSKLIDTEKLMSSAQALADRKLEESAHYIKVHGELSAQYEHMRHMQHVTNEALNSTREELKTTTCSHLEQINRVAGLKTEVANSAATIDQLRCALSDANATATQRQAQIDALENAVRQLKSSRSWRWTAWLRSLGRVFSSRNP